MVLLALDVGNTNITIGVFRDRAIISQWRLSTSLHRTVDELGILVRQLCQWAQLSADDISGVIVGSVVPPLDGTLRAAISNYLHTEPLFVMPLMHSGIPLEVETPHELGADRLCNVVAAYAEHGGPCVVVDFGTATTWEVISADGAFLGGVIAPRKIWAYGLRNPWRMSFDRLTHDLYIGDVGQSAREEVNVQSPASSGGENYGWRVMEGSLCFDPSSGCDRSGKVLPVTEYDHSLGCAVTGGYVYRGTQYPDLEGYYFYGDFCSGRLFSLYKDPVNG